MARKNKPEKYELKLSDAYAVRVDEPELELVCTVYNINKGRNKELLEKCPFLKEYMIFVDYVRFYNRQFGRNDLEHAIEVAIDRCIEENVLREFFISLPQNVYESDHLLEYYPIVPLRHIARLSLEDCLIHNHACAHHRIPLLYSLFEIFFFEIRL